MRRIRTVQFELHYVRRDVKDVGAVRFGTTIEKSTDTQILNCIRSNLARISKILPPVQLLVEEMLAEDACESFKIQDGMRCIWEPIRGQLRLCGIIHLSFVDGGGAPSVEEVLPVRRRRFELVPPLQGGAHLVGAVGEDSRGVWTAPWVAGSAGCLLPSYCGAVTYPPAWIPPALCAAGEYLR
eukprot:Polyplicarium_translucidae@DN5632_c0_g1_i1.p1